jgi:hypothetical protein
MMKIFIIHQFPSFIIHYLCCMQELERCAQESAGVNYILIAGQKCLPPAPRTDWTRLVPPPVLTGHAASFILY